MNMEGVLICKGNKEQYMKLQVFLNYQKYFLEVREIRNRIQGKKSFVK